MNDNAKNTRRDYFRKYRQENREKLNAYSREWRKTHPVKAGAIAVRYWEKKAEEARCSQNGGGDS